VTALGHGAHSRTLLVVEDDDLSRFLLDDLLSTAGHRVVAAATEEEAVEAVRAEHFDIIVTDLRLQNGRGDDLARKVHHLQPDIAVIYVSGEPPSQTAVDGVFIEKPIDIEVLLASIEKCASPKRGARRA